MNDNHTSARHYTWNDLPREEINASIGRRMITGTNMMIAHIYLKKDAIVPLHSHHNEQITYVLKGALKLVLGKNQDREFIVRAGEVLVI
ncbi:MAG TPA: cupin domain-containing protein, partial [Xanthomonadales bacterium]|nr:cupin domain-containing protein [Xanthomonadales bacterium]